VVTRPQSGRGAVRTTAEDTPETGQAALSYNHGSRYTVKGVSVYIELKNKNKYFL